MASFAHTINVKDMRYPIRDAVHVREEKNIIIEDVVSDISDYLSDDSDCSSFSDYSSGYEDMISSMTKNDGTNKILKLPHSFVKLERCDHLLTLFPGKTFYGTCNVTSMTPSLSTGRSRRPANLFYSQDFVIFGIDEVYDTIDLKTAKKSKYSAVKRKQKQNAELKKPSLKNFSKNKTNYVKSSSRNECKKGLACVKGRDFFVSDSRSEYIPKDHPVPVYMTCVKDDVYTTVCLHNGKSVTHDAKCVNGSVYHTIHKVSTDDANKCDECTPVGHGLAVCDRSKVKDIITIDTSDEDSDIDIESDFFVTNLISDKEIIDHDHSYAMVVETLIPKPSGKNQISASSLSHQTKTIPDENKPMPTSQLSRKLSKADCRRKERERREVVNKHLLELKDLFPNLRNKEHLYRREVLHRSYEEICMLKKVNKYLINRKDRLLKYQLSLITRYKKLRRH